MAESSDRPVHRCFHPMRSVPKMVPRTSNSKAKKLVHDALHTFKSFISAGYQKLPKTHTFSISSCTRSRDWMIQIRSFRKPEYRFCHELEEKKLKGKEKLPAMKRYESLREGDELYNGSFLRFGKSMARREARQAAHQTPRTIEDQEKRNVIDDGEVAALNSRRIELCLAMVKRLKEIEQMDNSNDEHVLDIEEVLHYYSRITCPSYIDLFNMYFMEVYAEFRAQNCQQISETSYSQYDPPHS